jgi:hypothetical protein
MLTTGEQLTALNLLSRWRRAATATAAELEALELETAAFVDLPDISVDVYVGPAPAALELVP